MNIQAFIEIAAQIRSNVTDVKTIDIFNDQYNRSKEHPYATPCVWVEFLPANWNSAGGVQEGLGGIRLHCEIELMKDTRNLDEKSDDEQDYIIGKMGFAERVHAAIQGFAVDGWSAFERVQTVPDHNHDKNIIEILEYACQVSDDSSDPYDDYIEVTPGLSVPGEIVTPPGEELGDFS